MSIFNEEQIKAMFSREYICHECGHLMEFEDEWEDTLVCPHCGHSIDLDDYGREGNEAYNASFLLLRKIYKAYYERQ